MTAGLLLALLAVELALPGAPATAPATAAPAPPGLPIQEPLGIVPAWPAILRAPIFAPDRRLAGGRSTDAEDDLVLLGVALSRRGGSAAVQTGGSVTSVPVGGRIGRWRLVAVGRDHARLASGAEMRTLAIGASRHVASAASSPASDGE